MSELVRREYVNTNFVTFIEMLEKYVSWTSLRQVTLIFKTSLKYGTAITLFSPFNARTNVLVQTPTAPSGSKNLILILRSCGILSAIFCTNFISVYYVFCCYSL
jgi:hypothetical protein